MHYFLPLSCPNEAIRSGDKSGLLSACDPHTRPERALKRSYTTSDRLPSSPIISHHLLSSPHPNYPNPPTLTAGPHLKTATTVSPLLLPHTPSYTPSATIRRCLPTKLSSPIDLPSSPFISSPKLPEPPYPHSQPCGTPPQDRTTTTPSKTQLSQLSDPTTSYHYLS